MNSGELLMIHPNAGGTDSPPFRWNIGFHSHRGQRLDLIIANAHIYAYIPRITLACLRIDKYGDIVLLLIQLSHISVSADCKDYCYISRSSIMMVNVLLLMSSVIYTYIHVYISM